MESSLSGLIWLKLVSGRAKDDADIAEIAKVRMAEMEGCRSKLPVELHERFDVLVERAKREWANDPSRMPDDAPPDGRVQELVSRYGRKAPRKTRNAAKPKATRRKASVKRSSVKSSSAKKASRRRGSKRS